MLSSRTALSIYFPLIVRERVPKLLLAIINPIGRFIEAYALLLEAYVPPSTFADNLCGLSLMNCSLRLMNRSPRLPIDNIIAFVFSTRQLLIPCSNFRLRRRKLITFGLLLWLASTSVTPSSSLCYPLPKGPCSAYGTRTRNYHLERVVT